jgi:hypothetical protein
MRFHSVAAVLVLLASCAQTDHVSLSNGQQAVRVTCNLAIDGMASCFRTAGNLCGPRGFVLFDWNGQPWAMPYPGPDVLQDDPGLARNGLLVACRS